MTTTQTQPPALHSDSGSELQGIYTKRGSSLDIAHYKPVNPKATGDKEKGWTLALVGPAFTRSRHRAGGCLAAASMPCVHTRRHTLCVPRLSSRYSSLAFRTPRAPRTS